jgi:hypothetical protein
MPGGASAVRVLRVLSSRMAGHGRHCMRAAFADGPEDLDGQESPLRPKNSAFAGQAMASALSGDETQTLSGGANEASSDAGRWRRGRGRKRASPSHQREGRLVRGEGMLGWLSRRSCRPWPGPAAADSSLRGFWMRPMQPAD